VGLVLYRTAADILITLYYHCLQLVSNKEEATLKFLKRKLVSCVLIVPKPMET
jgi:hypothetical protein